MYIDLSKGVNSLVSLIQECSVSEDHGQVQEFVSYLEQRIIDFQNAGTEKALSGELKIEFILIDISRKIGDKNWNDEDFYYRFQSEVSELYAMARKLNTALSNLS